MLTFGTITPYRLKDHLVFGVLCSCRRGKFEILWNNQKYKLRRTVALLASTTYANIMAEAKDIPIINAFFLIIDCAYWTISHARSSFFIHCYLFSHIIVRYIIYFSYA